MNEDHIRIDRTEDGWIAKATDALWKAKTPQEALNCLLAALNAK